MIKLKPDHSQSAGEGLHKTIPKQAREFFAFIDLVSEAATGDFHNDHVQTDIRCFKKGCHGLIQTELFNLLGMFKMSE